MGGIMNEVRVLRLKKVLLTILGCFVLLHTGLLVAYYIGHAIWGNQLWMVDAIGYMLPFLFLPSLLLLPLAFISRSKVIIITAVIPLLLFILTYGHFFLPKGPTSEASPSFTVMTFNVLDLNEQYDDVASQITTYDPDVLGLHELESHMVAALYDLLSSKYPYREIEPTRGFFSRYPIERYDAFQLSGDGHWAQEVDVEVEGNTLTFLNVHPRSPRVQYDGPLGFPSDLDTDARDRDFDDLLSRIEDRDGTLIVMGDMNLSDRQDQYGVLKEYLGDAHREAGWGLGFTRTNYPQIGLPTWRIDYIFYSPDLMALLSEVGEFAGSDHRPVIAKLGFKEIE